jgi:hypothetical protein
MLTGHLPNYDAAIIGYTINGRPVYDYSLLVAEIERRENCDAYEAAAWIDHNFVGVKDAPIIMQSKEDDECLRIL